MDLLGMLYRTIPCSVYNKLFPFYSNLRFSSQYKEILEILKDKRDTDEDAAELERQMISYGYLRFFYGDWISRISEEKVVISRDALFRFIKKRLYADICSSRF